MEPFLKRLAEAGRIAPHIANNYQDDGKGRGFSHVHNEFLNSLVTRGWFGLLIVVLLFLVTSLLFFRIAALRRAPESDVAFAGLLLVVGYAHFALTESVLIHPVTLNFFLISLVTVAYLTRSREYGLTGRGGAAG